MTASLKKKKKPPGYQLITSILPSLWPLWLNSVSSTVPYLPWLGAYQTGAEGFLLRCVAQVAADAMAQTAKLPAQPAGREMDFLFKP